MYNPSKATRINAYHSQKRSLLGSPANQIPPAWREPKPDVEPGSKILLSRLPPDVSETEVEDLFRKTVGPLREVFLVYNSQGRSKGMAIISFQRPGDAAVARAKYDGKFVDGRRQIKIEVIVDSDEVTPKPAAPSPPSLLQRLGLAPPISPPGNAIFAKPAPNHTPNNIQPKAPPKPLTARVVSRPPTAVIPRRRKKKGPKRVQKSVSQLDNEMEEYRAAAKAVKVNGNGNLNR
ncbi:hypothetical protein F5J12DRAFT_813219 [Pisolithus orientalis]|uniref:uncharacterized protein n=1 Tax=Pisolithus orientalis TaxID=936130 RepID=UPI0022257E6D|nr:uncharacterized protein F5J12DRAFT_813219 [Pisolithus orientalis]KAI6019794.1 hypothetical protein F5J12DRAFT_813219 [Pisolithus orientalis]